VKTVLHTEASPGWGGQEIRTLAEARWTAERGWRVVLACQRGGRMGLEARAAGLSCHEVAMRGPWDLAAVAQLAGCIRREGVSLVHTHSSIDAWVGGLAARLRGVPVVRTRHVSIPIRRGAVFRWLADRVVTSGEAIGAMVRAAGVPAARVVAIPAGVQLDGIDAAADAGPAVRRALGLGAPVVGSVAMFRGSKGHQGLLEAFGRLAARRPGASLLLVGDGIRRAWVEQLAREMGLGGRVVFPGFRPDVPALLAAMDCFVLASTRTEGVPQSLLQAMAARVPVVASAVGGIPEVIEDGVTGLLVPPGDAAALAAAIERVLDEPAGARARAAAARALCERRFSHAAAIERLLAVYEELLGGPVQPAAAG
jgi:glycosyltransferase involved in cell wall biosynthesis